MRRRSKSVFVGAEVAHYFSKNSAEENDQNDEVNNDSDLSEEEISQTSNEEINNDDDDEFDNPLLLIQQVHAQIPQKDKLPFDERLDKINWNEVNIPNAKRKILKVIEQERKHRLLHEILEESQKRCIKNLDIKKPTSALGLFIVENKDAIKKIMEKKGSKNMITTANEEFKKLTEKQKRVFFEKVSSAKGTYNEELKKYTLTYRKGKERKERKTTPFVLYQQHQNLKGEVAPKSELNKKYNELPSTKKLIWILRFLGVNRGDKLTYEQYINAKENLTKDEFQIIEDYEGKPKKIVPYNIFVKEYFKNSNSKDIKVAMKECALAWNNMSPEEKSKYQAQISKTDWEKRIFEYLNNLSEERRNLEIDSNPKLSRKAFEKMTKTYSSSNSSFKSMTPLKSSTKINDSIKEKQQNTSSRKTKKNMESIEKISPKKSKLFSKFEDDEKTSPSPNKKQSSFSKFLDQDSVLVRNSVDMPKPMEIKEEVEKKSNKNVKTSFPKPIKIENESDSEKSKTKKSKFHDDSFEDFKSTHNSTKIEPSPAKKKKRLDSSSESEIFLKPPKTVYKYFVQSVHKGPPSSAKAAFAKLNPKELKKLNVAFKKARANFLTDFEKRIQSMTSEQLERFSKNQKQISSQDDEEDDSD